MAALTAALFLAGCKEEQGAASPASGARSELDLQLSDFRFTVERGRNTYYHSRKYVEKGSVGVTLNRGKVCVENGKICVESAVQYRVEASATLNQPNHKVATTLDKHRITIEYWGSADNDEPVHIQRVVKTDGKTASVE